MKKFILILFVLLIPSIFAQSIEVDYPEEVQIAEEFIFELKLIDFAEDNYDVKIDILGGGERIAKILNNNEWKSTYYYITDAISQNQEKEFSMIISEYKGTGKITIKIRDSSGKTEIFEDYEIKIVEEKQETIESNNSQNNISLTNDINESKSSPVKEKPETINLNPKDIKTKEDNETSDNNAMLYFIIFCVLLALLLIIKKIRSNRDGLV